MIAKNIEINLTEEDWKFIASEIERLKRETAEDVTEAQVIATLIETGICREIDLRMKMRTAESRIIAELQEINSNLRELQTAVRQS